MAIRDPGEAPDLKDILERIGNLGGGSSSPKGASGTAEADKIKRFIKTYRNLLIDLYGLKGITDWHRKIMATAAKNEIAGSVFIGLIRRYDPRYVRTEQYKDRVASAAEEWERWYPGKKPPQQLVNGFARSKHNQVWLRRRFENTARVRRDYRFMDVAAKAGSAAGQDPGAYRAYRDALNASYRTYLGREATPLEQKMMFSSGMTNDEFQVALANVFGGAGSFRWAQGYVPETKKLQAAAFNAKAGDPLYGAIGQARASQQGYMSSRLKPFDFGLDEETEAIVMPRI